MRAMSFLGKLSGYVIPLACNAYILPGVFLIQISHSPIFRVNDDEVGPVEDNAVVIGAIVAPVAD